MLCEYDSDSSSNSGKSEFDEEYHMLKPPGVSIKDDKKRKIVKIKRGQYSDRTFNFDSQIPSKVIDEIQSTNQLNQTSSFHNTAPQTNELSHIVPNSTSHSQCKNFVSVIKTKQQTISSPSVIQSSPSHRYYEYDYMDDGSDVEEYANSTTQQQSTYVPNVTQSNQNHYANSTTQQQSTYTPNEIQSNPNDHYYKYDYMDDGSDVEEYANSTTQQQSTYVPNVTQSNQNHYANSTTQQQSTYTPSVIQSNVKYGYGTIREGNRYNNVALSSTIQQPQLHYSRRTRNYEYSQPIRCRCKPKELGGFCKFILYLMLQWVRERL